VADEVTTTTAAEFSLAAALYEVIQDALYSVPVMRPLCTIVNMAGRMSKAVDLPKWPALTAAQLTEATAAANTSINPTEVTITVAEHGILADITKFLLRVSMPTLQDYARQMAKSVVDLLDTDLAALLAGFSVTVGTTTVDLTEDNILNATRLLVTADSHGPYCGVLHPIQVYDLRTSSGSALGFMQSASVSEASGTFAGPQGFIGDQYGVSWYQNTNVPTANCAADRAGAVFTKGQAIAGAILWDLEVETLYRPDLRSTQTIVTSAWGEIEYHNAHGISVITDA